MSKPNKVIAKRVPIKNNTLNNNDKVVEKVIEKVVEKKEVENKVVEKKVPEKKEYIAEKWKKKQIKEYVKKGKKPVDKNQQSKLKYKALPTDRAPIRVKGGKLGMTYKGKPTNYVLFNKNPNGQLTSDMVRNFATNVGIGMYNKGKRGQMMVSINFGGRVGWRSGYFTNIGIDSASTYEIGDSDRELTEEDLNNIQSFAIYFTEEAENAGGNNENNDCLYNCLKEVMGDRCPFGSGSDMKEYLKLERNEKVPLTLMHEVDEYIGKDYKIVVSGDYMYNSSKKTKYEIRLKLLEGHYSVDNEDRLFFTSFSQKSHRPIFYMKEIEKIGNEKKISYMVYDGKYKKKLEEKDFIEFKNNKPMGSMLIYNDDFKTVEESYNNFIETADKLKKETNGRIDLYKTKSYVETALKLFDEMTKNIYCEKIEQNEAEWINQAMISAVIYAEKGYKGKAYKYDYNSMYGSLLVKKEFLIPIKKGRFETIEELPNILKYGIYNVEIEYQEHSYFRYNKDNKYTHIDIYIARMMDLGVKLFIYEDNQPNALIYDRECLINSHWLFESFIMEMFRLKQKKIPGAKQIGNCLWGALCRKNLRKKVINYEEKYDFPSDSTIDRMNPINEEKMSVEFCYNNKIFETNYARLGPFLLAKGRELIIKTALPYKEYIKRIHTDSMTSTIELPFEHSLKLGELKFEGYSDEIEIIHTNCVKGEFKV